MSGNVVVAIRIRPLASRELQISTESVAHVIETQTILHAPTAKNGRRPKNEAPKVFNFDYSYDSTEKSNADYADQARLYSDLGVDLLSKAFLGYNCCIFAYGQTGSGKSYTMMGQHEDRGLIPRICENLFRRIAEETDSRVSYSVEVSYLEIYSEKVRDLLNPRNKASLRVREHPITGPYVVDLSKLAALEFSDIERLMDEGNKTRTVASTSMNESSSRSHAVFSIILTQKRMLQDISTEKVSKISLVDLAGSERAESTGATGLLLKEGAEINRSLSTLGRVISALAERQTKNNKTRSVVPYRDSVLTWLLKDSLGGNSSTAMIATISPSVHHYEETLSTLRYAQSAKHIKNHAIVNEDVNMKLIRELQEELTSLRSQMGNTENLTQQPLAEQMISIKNADGSEQLVSKAEIADRIAQSDRLVYEMNMSWEEKLQNTLKIQQEREALLTEYGIDISSDLIGLSTPKKLPHLVNLSEDPLLTELLVYNIKPGVTVCGNPESSSGDNHCDIKLTGFGILPQHCVFRNNADSVTMEPSHNAYVSINGSICTTVSFITSNEAPTDYLQITTLWSGCRIALANEESYLFRFQNPQEARRRTTQASASVTPSRAVGSPRLLRQFSLLHRNPEVLRSPSDIQGNLSTSNKHAVEALARPSGEEDNRSRSVSPITESSSTRLLRSSDSSMTEGTSLSRKRNSDSEQLIQMLNAAAIEAEARGIRQSSNPLERLAAAAYEADLQLRHATEAPRFSIEAAGVAASTSQGYLKRAISRWRQLRDVTLTRSMLQNAQLLRNAQNIAHHVGRNIYFQYTTVNCLIEPISPHEEDRVFDTLVSSSASTDGIVSLATRVMDHDKNVLYVFSLAHLQRQIEKYRQRQNHKFLPFLDKFAPTYSLVGQASIVLPRGSIERSLAQTVDIYSPYTNVQCAILGLDIVCTESEGKLSLSLKGLTIQGFSEKDISNVHVHAFFGNDTDKRFTTQIINGYDNGAVKFDKTHVCQLSVLDLPDSVHFHVYGTISERYMLTLHSWDDLQESAVVETVRPLGYFANLPIRANFHISEMNAEGQYLPSEVLPASKPVPEVFYLHQGLSRRIKINLSYPGLQTFEVRKIVSIEISSIRIVTSSGREASDRSNKDQVSLKLMSDSAEPAEGGTYVLAQWDSSMHNTKALDRVTPPNKYVLITISMTICTSIHDTLRLESDLALRVYGRDENLGYLSRLFAAKTALEVTKVFSVPLRQKYGCISDQSNNHKLSIKRSSISTTNSPHITCKPRNVSLIQGFRRMVRHQQNSMALQETKMNYDPDTLETRHPRTPVPPERLDMLVRNIVRYWQLRTLANQNEPDLLQRAMNSMAADDAVQPPVIYATCISQEKTHSGHLSFSATAESNLVKAYFVLSGSYFLQYPSSSQSSLESVINLHSAQIAIDAQDVLSFSIRAYGKCQSYRSTSHEERERWLDALTSASIGYDT